MAGWAQVPATPQARWRLVHALSGRRPSADGYTRARPPVRTGYTQVPPQQPIPRFRQLIAALRGHTAAAPPVFQPVPHSGYGANYNPAVQAVPDMSAVDSYLQSLMPQQPDIQAVPDMGGVDSYLLQALAAAAARRNSRIME